MLSLSVVHLLFVWVVRVRKYDCMFVSDVYLDYMICERRFLISCFAIDIVANIAYSLFYYGVPQIVASGLATDLDRASVLLQ